MRKVIVVPYDEEWKTQFEVEAQALRGIFGEDIITVHHIGSTSVPGLGAKPVIDILPVVPDLTRVDQYNSVMSALGYEAKGENGLPGRRYFQKGGDDRTHHVHIYKQGNPEIERHLAFRDYLRAHPEEAARYGELKTALANRFPYDVSSYIEGKHKMATEIEEKALVWLMKNDGEV